MIRRPRAELLAVLVLRIAPRAQIVAPVPLLVAVAPVSDGSRSRIADGESAAISFGRMRWAAGESAPPLVPAADIEVEARI